MATASKQKDSVTEKVSPQSVSVKILELSEQYRANAEVNVIH